MLAEAISSESLRKSYELRTAKNRCDVSRLSHDANRGSNPLHFIRCMLQLFVKVSNFHQ